MTSCDSPSLVSLLLTTRHLASIAPHTRRHLTIFSFVSYLFPPTSFDINTPTNERHPLYWTELRDQASRHLYSFFTATFKDSFQQTTPHDALQARRLHRLPPRTFAATEHLQLLSLHPRPHKAPDASFWCPVVFKFQHRIPILSRRHFHDQRRRSPDVAPSSFAASVLEARRMPPQLAFTDARLGNRLAVLCFLS